VPLFEPFRGIRYPADRFRPADVTAPPYDVIDAGDRARLIARSPRNAVVVDLPVAPGDDVAADAGDPYATAAQTFATWQSEGTLETDERPSFTVYRMGYHDDLGRPVQTIGVMGAVELSRPGEGGLLPHEHTTPKARSDRLDLLRSTSANLSAIWGLSLTKGLSALLEVTEAPLWHWADEVGVDHTVWRVDEPERVAQIRAAVGETPIVIADGHHRYETCLAYRDERRTAAGGAHTAADSTLCFVVELVDDQLTVRPIHRLISGPASAETLRAALTERCFRAGEEVTADAVADGRVLRRMADVGALALVDPDGSATLLHPVPECFEGVADLDSARLDHALASVENVEVAYQHGVDLVLGALSSGRAQAGVLLRPATVAQIEANAHRGERMPPKTTFFHPKPKTGIVFRDLN
jgi:uncharacterized protein (DUF1015 family)